MLGEYEKMINLVNHEPKATDLPASPVKKKTKDSTRVLIGSKPIVYCACKLIENFYKYIYNPNVLI